MINFEALKRLGNDLKFQGEIITNAAENKDKMKIAFQLDVVKEIIAKIQARLK